MDQGAQGKDFILDGENEYSEKMEFGSERVLSYFNHKEILLYFIDGIYRVLSNMKTSIKVLNH